MRALQPNRIDYAARLRENPQAEKRRVRKFLLMLPFAVILFTSVAIVGNAHWKTYRVEKARQAQFSEKIEQEDLVARAEKTVELQDTASWIESNYENLASADAALQADPDLTRAVYAAEENARAATAGVVLTGMTFERAAHTVTLQLTAKNADEIPKFVEALDSALLTKVHYGYTQSGEDGEYEFTVSGTVAEAEG